MVKKEIYYWKIIQVDMKYPGNSLRPDSFKVNYSINGEKFKTTFSNKPNAYAK